MKNFIVVIPCGFRKVASPTIAGRLYTGPYFKCNLRWALSVADQKRIFILSAKHGLVPLHKVLSPYNLKMGQKGSVTAEQVSAQAKELGLDGYRVYAIGGKAYLNIIKSCFSEVRCPVEGMPLGRSNQILKMNHGKLP